MRRIAAKNHTEIIDMLNKYRHINFYRDSSFGSYKPACDL